MTYRFRAPLWRYRGDSAWHFVTLPFDEADEIDERTRHVQRGFGSVRVKATVGASTWTTSLFPDTEASSYLLPVKQAVRTAEGVGDGDDIEVTLELLDV